ncbi:hypothetical protein [Halomonas nitroreducens]|uniref:Phage tail assembly protein n=1 Tax=Halomonas nitroreducens TaxID=447425 RepID=A0A3S0JWQ3_9GAMM|nr:hypothetical protein [Halomonas nitroreducens]RTR01938.1 hypothetical protein EKG36_13095 [Halomonas nitroreducens]
MTFVLKSVPDITVPVTIQVPGEAEAKTIEARWRLHPVSRTQELLEQQRLGELTDEALVGQDLLGLEGITDEAGEAVPFSDELVAQLLDIAYVRRPLVLSWFAAQQGRAEAAAKN